MVCFKNWTILRFLSLAISISLLGACSSGGGGGGNSARGKQVNTGQFIDSAVTGLQYTYIASGNSGTTGADGSFSVQAGSLVEFHIGTIVLGQSAATHLMSPVNFGSATTTSNNITTNIARFLQIIDDDADLSNGIMITENLRSLAANMSINFNQTPLAFENDGNVQSVVSQLTAATTAGARMLTAITVVDAQNHLNTSLQNTLTNNVDTFFGTSSSDFQNCISSARDSVANGSITINQVNAGSHYFSGSGTFEASVGGITVQEDMIISGTFYLDGTMSGNIDSDAYQNGMYVGSGYTSFSGTYSQTALVIKIPTMDLPQYGAGCIRDGEIVVEKQ